MGYKLLGIVVWRAARWYVRRRYPDAPRQALIGAAGVAALAAAAGGIAAAVQRSQSDPE